MSEHQFLKNKDPEKTSRAVRDVALDLMNHYWSRSFSRSKWLKIKAQSLGWHSSGKDNNGNVTRTNYTSEPFSLELFESHIHKSLSFNHSDFKLFPLQCGWLDGDFGFGIDVHVTDPDGDTLQLVAPMRLGSHFPLTPTLDREGQVFNSLQGTLQMSIVEQRNTLISTSSQFTSTSWLNSLRFYISDSVSLIDMTLHHLYIKAEYDPLPDWNFNREALGNRHGRRLRDKFRWIYLITGNSLSAPAEMAAFNQLRKLRNHLQHFDPPCFAYSLEDVACWLNLASGIGRLAWKMRSAMGSPLTSTLVSLIVAPEVVFTQKYADRLRAPQREGKCYSSTCWPPQLEENP